MTRKCTIVFHIGTEKTGSTTLQNTLHLNRRKMSERGVFYLTLNDRIESRSIAAAALGTGQPDDYFMRYGIETSGQRAEYQKNTQKEVHEILQSLSDDIHTVVVSSEHLHSRVRRSEQIAWLKSLFDQYAIEYKVICYLRRQTDMVESYYSTMLKNGEVRSLKDIVGKTCKSSNHYYNYKKLLDLWGEVFGQASVNPRVFEKKRLVHEDIVEDFFHVLEMESLLKSIKLEKNRFNESLSPLGQAMLRAINLYAKEMQEKEDALLSVRADIIKDFSGKGERLGRKEWLDIDREFEGINEAVRDKWFPCERELFSAREVVQRRRVELNFPITEQQIILVEKVVALLLGGNNQVLVKPLNSCASMLRDLAIFYEDKDVNISWRLMGAARKIRPSGPVIQRKYAAYERIRSRPLRRLKRWMSGNA